ncbi:Poly(A)+ RNA export protein [Sistotremastrum suecicum HHB10207 ss-3]|uniref:Poly(A)+ RNA export protein n=1 Tax=Sistotremastrum suecicum HHB10207 ss-3 TaxID=1314776 RepID=A0A166GKQ7_9AGAM|nr:Poly(A)+ RNA export protein [Sistotremastrum suecicum HHB10207 ss-3]
MSFFNTNNTATSSSTVADKDIEVADAPTDSISSLAFSPTADYLAVGSWSNEVRIYEVGQSGQTQGKAAYSHEQPVLSVCWNKEGTRLFSGGADKAGRMFDVTTGQAQQVAQHDAPVKCVKWIDSPSGGILATGSWDKTVKYWDLRTPNPVSTVQLPERCYTMDVVYPLMVVGTAERHIQMYNLANPTTPYRVIESPLKWQTRVVSCFPAANGFAVGSIEGRVAIQYVEEKDTSQNFSFKCHRKDGGTKDSTLVFSVNDISFHQQHGTFSTAGADGTINFWDKDSRTRLKTFDPAPGPITATAFNRTGSIYAYAVSYDWSKGHSGMVANHPNKVMLHACKEEEVKKRAKVAK